MSILSGKRPGSTGTRNQSVPPTLNLSLPTYLCMDRNSFPRRTRTFRNAVVHHASTQKPCTCARFEWSTHFTSHRRSSVPVLHVMAPTRAGMAGRLLGIETYTAPASQRMQLDISCAVMIAKVGRSTKPKLTVSLTASPQRVPRFGRDTNRGRYQVSAILPGGQTARLIGGRSRYSTFFQPLCRDPESI